LERRLGGPAQLQAEIADMLKGPYLCSIAHVLLQSLPTNTCITQNYDVLFEQACHDAGTKINVLPYDLVTGDSRWLLKMHGCVNHPEDIVLTRDDYLNYADRRQSLKGIVSAQLLTKHMLFIGFSMNDPNFFAIASDVKKSLPRRNRSQTFGTSLQLIGNDLSAELWDGDVDFLNILELKDRSATGADWAAAARGLEVFLDFLMVQSAKPFHDIFRTRFQGMLTDADRLVKQTLENALNIMLRDSKVDVTQSMAFQQLESFISQELGGGAVVHKERIAHQKVYGKKSHGKKSHGKKSHGKKL
jgi:hypothetical protein